VGRPGLFLALLVLVALTVPAAASAQAGGDPAGDFEVLDAAAETPCPCADAAGESGGGAAEAEGAGAENGGSAEGGANAGAASDGPKGIPEALSYRVVTSGVNSAQGDTLMARADTAEGLSDLWMRVARTRIPAPDPPEIDFSRETVVAIFAGERPTGGYGLSVDAVCREEAPGIVHICYTEHEPPEDAILTMALTSPYLLIALDRPVAEIVVHRRTVVRE
jgi:hypothetical protein